jgi:hypothetical protein
VGLPILIAVAAALAGLATGFLLLRTELKSTGALRMSPRVALACLQGMIGAFAIVVVLGLSLVEPSRAVAEEPEVAEAFQVLTRFTLAGALGWLPIAFVLLVMTVRELWGPQESKRLPLALTAMAIYLVMLFVLVANPSLLR